MYDKFNDVDAKITDVGRVYFNDEFIYPSVTTVLGVVDSKEWLDTWKQNVGDEFATRYIKRSTDIGTAMHFDYECFIAEQSLKSIETDEERTARRMFNSSKPAFQKLYGSCIMQEALVISHKYKIAGRFDLLAYDKSSKIILLDFKTTKNDKRREDIQAYKYQLAFYNRMLKESYQIDINEHIVFMVTHSGFPKIFRFDPNEVTDNELMKIRGKFYRLHGM